MISSFRADIKEVFRTAWPLMLSTGLFSVTLFVDRMLLYQYSEKGAAAAMAAGSLFWSVTCLPAGVCGYTSTFVAQYLAVKRLDRALHVVWQAVLLGLAIGPLFLLIGLSSKSFFLWSGHPMELATDEASFFLWLIPGAWSTVISSALVGLFAGSGRTMVLLYTDAIVTIAHAFLDVILIFGYFGFPELGVAGAAIASSFVLFLKLVVLVLFAWRYCRIGAFVLRPSDGDNTRTERGTGSESTALDSAGILRAMTFDRSLMNRLIHFGWPAGVSVVAEAWSFTAITIFVGQLGERPLAATTLALGVNVIAFIPLVGLGMAIGVLVGQYLVQRDIAHAQRMVQCGLIVGIVYSLIFVVMYGIFPDFAMNVYAIGNDPERFADMKPVLRPLLQFIALYCVFDAFQTVFVGALKGAGDTRFVLYGHIASGAGTVSLGYLFSKLTGMGGLYYWWSIMSIWVIVLAIVFTARYLHGGWKTKRVIEHQLVVE